MSTAKAQPNGAMPETKAPPESVVITDAATKKSPEQVEIEGLRDTVEALTKALRESVENLANAPKPFDSYFSVEYQSQLAAKYTAKYSEADQKEHLVQWPVFAGNHCTLYILAESQNEARKAVFSANAKTLTPKLAGSLVSYTPTVPGTVLTELQVTINKMTDLQLQEICILVPGMEQRVELLKVLSKNLKAASKTGKDTDVNRAKFNHAALSLGYKTPSTLW